MSNKVLWALVLGVCLLVGYSYLSGPQSTGGVGGTTNLDSLSLDGTLAVTGAVTTGGTTIGSSGTALTQVLKGACTATSNGATISATSSALVSCAVTSVASGDTTFVQLATSTNLAANQWTVAGSLASTTASGSIEVKLVNLSGGAAAVPAAILAGMKYVVLR